MVQPFSPTLLVEVEYGQHKYGGCLHLSKLCVWGDKGSSTRALACLVGRGEIRGCRLQEWSAEIWPLVGSSIYLIYGLHQNTI